jgi:hypothetical protein
LSKNTEPKLRTHKGREAAAKAAHHTTKATDLHGDTSHRSGLQAVLSRRYRHDQRDLPPGLLYPGRVVSNELKNPRRYNQKNHRNTSPTASPVTGQPGWRHRRPGL